MSESAAAFPPDIERRRLTTVVAVDVCGYSRLAEVDEPAAVKTVQFVQQIYDGIVARRRGRIFHRAGDGFLAEFPSATDGVLAALELCEELRRHDTLSPTGVSAKIRAGVHAGDVIDQPGGDLLGHGVNIACRLQGEAEPSGVLVSIHAVNLIRGHIDAAFRRRGPLALRNIDEPVVAFDVHREKGKKSLIPASLRRMRAVSPAVASMTLLAALLVALNLSMLDGVGRLQKGNDRAATAADSLIANRGGETSRYNHVDRDYLRRVLSDLVNSNQKSDALVFALIERNDIGAAVGKLEQALKRSDLSPQRRSELLHQVGALSYERDPDKAIAVYHEALRLNPGDFPAAVRLGRAYALQDKISDAEHYFDLARRMGGPDERAMLELDTHQASLSMHRYDMEAAIPMLSRVAERAAALGFSDLVSRARTSLGLAYFALDRNDLAKRQLNSAIAIQKSFESVDPEHARALNVLGQIEAKQGDFEAAIAHFESQYDIESRMRRAQGITDALYFWGDAYLALGEVDHAHSKFLEGLRVATEHRIADLVFLHYVGLARVAQREENREGACLNIREAERAYNGESKVGPKTRADLVGVGCGFGPLGIEPALVSAAK